MLRERRLPRAGMPVLFRLAGSIARAGFTRCYVQLKVMSEHKRISFERRHCSQYQGQCQRCSKIYYSYFVSNGQWNSEEPQLIPPPSITAVCQCQIPVTEVKLIYTGQVRQTVGYQKQSE